MAVGFKEIYSNTYEEYGLELLAGSLGLNNIIDWALRIESMAELPDEDSESAYERCLVMTSAAMIGRDDETALIWKLADMGSCGLMVVTTDVDRFSSQEVMSCCDSLNFPLIHMRDTTRVGELQREYISEIERDRNVSNTVNKVFAAVLSGKARIDNHEQLLRQQGFRFDAAYTCIVLYAEDKRQYIELQKIREWNRFLIYALQSLGVYASFQMGQYQVVILKDVDDEIVCKVMISFTKMLRRHHVGVVTRIGVGEQMDGLAYISQTYYAAFAAVRKARMDGEELVRFEDIGIYQLLFTTRDDMYVHRFVDRQLGALVRYDRDNDAGLVETLDRYFECNCSVKQVADQMHIHRNTANKRIQLIKELLTDNTLKGMDRTNLEMAIIAEKIFGQEGGSDHEE